MPSIMPTGKQQFTNNAGVPLAGGRVYTFAAGTTEPKATYQDAAGEIENPNPIVLNARGEALAFWDGAYTVKVTDANDVLVYTVDSYQAPIMPGDLSADDGADKIRGTWLGGVKAKLSDLGTSSGSSLIGFIQAAAGAVLRPLAEELRDNLKPEQFGAKGDTTNGSNGHDDTDGLQAAINEACRLPTRDRDVVLAAKRYRITRSLVVPPERNIRIIGQAGPFTGTQIFADFNGAIFTSDQAQTWSMENVQLVSDVDKYPQSWGIKLDSANSAAQVYMNFRNVTCNNLGYGIRLANPFACRFQGVKIASIKNRGLDIAGGSSSHFDVVIEQCGGDGFYLTGNGHIIHGAHLEVNCQNGAGARELILAGDHISMNSGIISPIASNPLPPVLLTGNAITIIGTKGYDLPAGVPHWIEIQGIYAGLVQIGDLSYGGNVANVVQMIAGVPGSSASDVLIGGASLVGSAVVEQGTNGNGRFVRYADGRQICTFQGFYAAAGLNYERTWIFPKAFKNDAASPVVVTLNPAAADPLYRPNAVARVKAVTASQMVANFSDSDIAYNAIATGFWK